MADLEEKFMRRAIALALENVRSGAGGPFAALIVKDGAIIAQGTNRVTSTNDPTAHAEIVAIREACRALTEFSAPAMRAVQHLRALPHVPRRDLLGAAGAHFLCRDRTRKPPPQGSTTDLFTRK